MKYFYEEIAFKYINEVKNELDFTYIDLFRAYEQKNAGNDKPLIPIFKVLSATHLMKLPVINDSNQLDNSFYRELLYLMGIEEVVDKNSKTHKIKRLAKGVQSFSLIEQVCPQLEDREIFARDTLFETSLSLVITWINRILFLKLLESQLIVLKKDQKMKFLNYETIPDYQVLYDLFMKVLAIPKEDRDEETNKRFKDVPYLNSSLFELSQLEILYFSINTLQDGDMDVYKQTVLKDNNGRKLSGKISSLDYLFRFLNAYDFGSEQTEDGIMPESKPLINASVLGLIFEKINGYKDGAFFTPSYITELISRSVIRQTIIRKFNEVKGWNCYDIEDIKFNIVKTREALLEANDIVNSIKICDPAVGSGHFLVSALNEMIAIKSELGILLDKQNKPVPITAYSVSVINDELILTNEDGEHYHYDPKDKTSRLIQEAIFEEKRTIIESCLFGVDINPKSVDICCLRLWIELLKNVYYFKTPSGSELQTLPNIDIKIKQGNSLASTQPVYIGKKAEIVQGKQKLIREYKDFIKEYKTCRSKKAKIQLKKNIDTIIKKLKPNTQLGVFISKKQKSMAVTMQRALEWMIIFPELLDDDFNFQGFDVVIGNPPYISLEKLKDDTITYGMMKRENENCSIIENNYKTIDPLGDIYTLFVERGLQLLNKGGLLSYIIPNKWEKVMYGKNLRRLFLKYNLTYLIDFQDNQIFNDATTYTCIIQVRNEKASEILRISNIEELNKDSLLADIESKKQEYSRAEINDQIWVTSSIEKFRLMKKIKDNEKFNTLGYAIMLKAYRGLVTGLTDMFVISSEQFESIVTKDRRSLEILRPFLQGRGLVAYGQAKAASYLIYTPKGLTLNGMGVVIEKEDKKNKKALMPSEDKAWDWFSSKYPAIAEWMLQFKDKAKKRADKGDYWWELRGCDYYDKFELPKIFYQVFQTKPCFVYDDTMTLCNNSMWMLSVNSKALIVLLCSKVGWWLISEHCPRIQNGYQLIWDNFRQIPIPSTLPTSLEDLYLKVESSIAKGNKGETEKFKKEIEISVCHLYDLTYEEVLIIDPLTSISKKEYNAYRDSESI